MRILTWHVHGSYLYYLSQTGHDLYLPVKPDRPEGYGGRCGHFPWPANVHDVPAEDVRTLPFDLVLFQSRKNYCEDQHDVLSARQRRLPRIHLEHDPPCEHPTNTRHFVDDPDVLLVHVTHFNRLMWDSGRTPSRVIEHGVVVPPGVRYSGDIARGFTAINGLESRGRRLGADMFAWVRERVPVDLAGMGSESLGGVGDIPRDDLLAFESRYRFFFSPVRYTSLGLAVCEAMMVGMPVVGLATAEMATVIEGGVSGYIDTDVARLVEVMHALLADPVEARRLGDGARRAAEERFGIARFARDWDAAFADVTGARASGIAARATAGATA